MNPLENKLLERPQLVVDLRKVASNLSRILGRLREGGVVVRPHFKTHQCAAIGEMFRSEGISAITVSSLDMAAYFASHGWRDITLAVPVNPGQLDAIREFDPAVRLNLLVGSVETTTALIEALDKPGKPGGKRPVWIKVDVGYGRVGIKWHAEGELLHLAKLVEASEHLEFRGLLTHSGHTYECRGREAVVALFEEGRARMLKLRQMLAGEDGWEVVPLEEAKVVSCCQEVSKLKVSQNIFDRISLGQTIYILPAHACLVAEVYPRYVTLEGKVLERFRLYR